MYHEDILFAVGGCNGDYLDTMDMYNVSREKDGRQMLPANYKCLLCRGDPLIRPLSGGYSNGSYCPELYELVSDGWVKRANMNHAREGHCICVLHAGRH